MTLRETAKAVTNSARMRMKEKVAIAKKSLAKKQAYNGAAVVILRPEPLHAYSIVAFIPYRKAEYSGRQSRKTSHTRKAGGRGRMKLGSEQFGTRRGSYGCARMVCMFAQKPYCMCSVIEDYCKGVDATCQEL